MIISEKGKEYSMEHFVWMWIGIIILAVVTEVFTDQLVSIWFIPGAFVSAILSLFSIDLLWQILVFAVISAIVVPVGKIFLGKNKLNNETKTNIDAIIGEKCVVSERIDNFAGCGLVRVKGQYWSARGVNENDVFDVGEVLSVVAIEGVKLICKKN